MHRIASSSYSGLSEREMSLPNDLFNNFESEEEDPSFNNIDRDKNGDETPALFCSDNVCLRDNSDAFNAAHGCASPPTEQTEERFHWVNSEFNPKAQTFSETNSGFKDLFCCVNNVSEILDYSKCFVIL